MSVVLEDRTPPAGIPALFDDSTERISDDNTRALIKLQLLVLQQFLRFAPKLLELLTRRLRELAPEANLPQRIELPLPDLRRPASARIIRRPVSVSVKDQM